MKFSELKKHLSQESYLPAYLVAGDDSFVVASSQKMFENIIEISPDMNIVAFTKTQDAQAITEALEVLPLLDKKRIVFVYDFLGNTDAFLKYLQNPNPSSILVFINSALKENFSKILTRVEFVDCNRLQESQLLAWISANLKKFSSSIETSAAKLLIEYCARDLTRISRELEKLSFFKSDCIITTKDVEEIVTADTEYKIFELAEAVASKQKQKAALILKSMTDQGMSPVNLLGMIYSHFRRIFYCAISDSNDIHMLLGVKEFAVTKAKQQAKAYSPLRLKRICDSFHQLDYGFKNGFITDGIALELFILTILNETII